MRTTIAFVFALILSTHAAEQKAELKNLSFNGGLEDGKARLVIEALLNGLPAEREKSLFATRLEDSLTLSRDKFTEDIVATMDILEGSPAELPLTINTGGGIRQVTGDGLQDWSVRQETNGTRILVLRPRRGDKPLTRLVVHISSERSLRDFPQVLSPLTLAPPQTALLSGYIKVESAADLDVQPDKLSGLLPIELQFLPDSLRPATVTNTNGTTTLAYQFQGTTYSLPLKINLADPEARRVVLRDFKLRGRLNDLSADFTLTATALVKAPKGGVLNLLSGAVALSALEEHPDWRVRFEQGRFLLVFEHDGEFPIQIKFNAAVRLRDGWRTLDFQVAPSALQPIVFEGLAPDTQFDFAGAARPERVGTEFTSYLPADGTVKLAWKEAKPEGEGKLFYAASMLSQISVSPGLMRQLALLDFKVMQGELNRVTFRVTGSGEVTRVQGDQVLAWNVTPIPNSADRLLAVQFNQARKDQFAIQIQMQTPLDAFPQAVNAVRLRPEGATSFAGYFRIVNEGAVRLEVAQATGLSQISPEQFPETDASRAALRVTGSQRFAYRFSGPDFALLIRADQILPELAVSQLLAYHLGENELAIDAELEVDIREAPLRELMLRIPRGYGIAKLAAAGLSDYFVHDLEGTETAGQDAGPASELRLVFGQPVTGRQVIQLRLERNQPLAETAWALPRIEVSKAKSVRGHLALAADAGYRLTPERTQALTELATALFPRKVPGIQSAFRLNEPNWQATVRVERLPQTVQADSFHLFSIGEGIAYGSSVLNYVVSGAPVSAFKVELSDEYFNVEFTGKDIRNWQKTNGGYLVQLHTPVSGAYTLLATYERPFKSQGETLTFTGARPLDAPTEQGYTLVISAYQFQVKPVEVSSGLLALEPGEVPPEYRLFFDSPILAAYRYLSRPFNLKLALSPMAQGDSLSQVVDRASLTTRISKEGQVITDARYFVKNRGKPNFRLTLPPGTELWSATVNGAAVVPVMDAQANLIPLPQHTDPNAVLTLDLKLAARSSQPTRVTVNAPAVNAPVLLAEWKLAPDAGQRLLYRRGTLTPVGGVFDASGFAQLARMFQGDDAGRALSSLVLALLLLGATLVAWRWGSQPDVYHFSLRHVCGLLFGLLGLALAVTALFNLGNLAEQHRQLPSRDLTFLVPVQQAASNLSLEVSNLPEKTGVVAVAGLVWPVILALVVWVYAWLTDKSGRALAGRICAWVLLAWSALRWPNGAQAFLLVFAVFLVWQVLIPALRGIWGVPRRPQPATVPPAQAGPASAVALWLIAALLSSACCNRAFAAGAESPDPSAANPQLSSPRPGRPRPAFEIPDSVAQEIRVADKFATGNVKLHWTAEEGQVLPLLVESAVLTQLKYPTDSLRLVQAPAGSSKAQLLARKNGSFDIELQYQIQVATKDNETGFTSPVQYGLINRLELTVANLEVDVLCPKAVSIQRHSAGSNTVASLVLSPANGAWISWRPLSRDVKREKPVFYAELSQLYVPAAGVIEGAHYLSIRPAQGELGELVLDVPRGATISDVSDPARPINLTQDKESAGTPQRLNALVSLSWRFDPDARKLRVTLNPPQSRPFALLVRSQIATGPLPFEQPLGLLSVENAAGQIGLLGVATGNDVQLDSVNAEGFSPINLEDFPADLTASLQSQFPGLTVRRAFRVVGPAASLRGTTTAAPLFSLKASPVEPDVRVETQDTISLGEDRTVLAMNATVSITRAGIFRLSFLMPAGFEVESISGSALSHWTELKDESGRVITLHLNGKTLGEQQFAINLAGAGVRATNAWFAPRVLLREASKQRGTLLLVPEQGLRLQAGTREGLTQLDPQKSGIKQKGVLAFRVLQTPWTLSLTIEQVAPWVQITSLQHATLNEPQVKIAANLQYQIENAGLKSFHIYLPTNAENVRFRGEQVADFLPVAGSVTNALQLWEVKLHRRVIGAYSLQANYQLLMPENAGATVLRGIQTADVNLQRGFVTIQAAGRLQVRAENLPAALQPTEWQSIPRSLQLDPQAASANLAYRLVEPAFELPLKLERHEPAKLLPARIENITFNSVISDDGIMLTQVRLEILPGNKRLLNLTLPPDANFWFAFVNQSGVWPWREQNQILIPLEQQSRGDKPMPVELFYSCRAGTAAERSLDLELLAPKFDLPLENLAWRVSLSDKWRVKHWSGSLQLQQDELAPQSAAINLQGYLQTEAAGQQERTREAEQLLNAGNSALEQGNPQAARRSFQAAYGLSTHDAAFNEDARVQLHNIKLQQALVGLNVRQATALGDPASLGAKFRDLHSRKELNYTQQDAKDIIDRNSADDNSAFMRLAERIIQQQDAAVSSPAAIRANIPEQGRVLMFKRAVVVDPWADLKLDLRVVPARPGPTWLHVLILGFTLAVVTLFTAAARRLRS